MDVLLLFSTGMGPSIGSEDFSKPIQESGARRFRIVIDLAAIKLRYRPIDYKATPASGIPPPLIPRFIKLSTLPYAGIAAARAKGKLPGRKPLDPEKTSAALKLVAAGVSPAEAARQLGLGRATVYREMQLTGVTRPTPN